MGRISGYVDHVRFRNEDNGYTVLSLDMDGDEETVVGVFQFLHEGEYMELEGEYVEHPVHGPQFQMTSYEVTMPDDIQSMERYLGSGAIKGVGPAIAKRIVKKFKMDTFRIIEEEPERLAEVKGVTEKRARSIAVEFSEKQEMRQAMMFLSGYGITTNLAVKIFKEYGDKLYGVIQNNPYQMADDIEGVGFKIADEIARQVGIGSSSDYRIISGIFYTLMQGLASGHIYLPKEILLRNTSRMLEVEEEMIEPHLLDMMIEKKIIIKEEEDQTRIYGAAQYYLELNTARMLCDLNMTYDVSVSEVRTMNAANPIETDVIIVDEMSMVDIFLMNSLLSAAVPGTRFVFVGDANQLPSVGPGNVLKDMIASGSFKVVELNQIFRQDEASHIVSNAHRINEGKSIELDNKSRDFFFLERERLGDILGVLVYLVRDKLPAYVNAKPYDIQVLTPMRKGELGVDKLNEVLQEYLNPPAEEKQEKQAVSCLFREGDKVMQIKNNYQMEWEVKNEKGFTVEEGKGVFNGDIGRITRINDYTEKVTVVFDDIRVAEYSYSMLDELELAYAVTIHKSQGSEYPAVVMPLLTGPRVLFNRNLLYTGVTRAKQCITMVGRKSTVQQMIQNVNEQKRYSTLCQRINEQEELMP